MRHKFLLIKLLRLFKMRIIRLVFLLFIISACTAGHYDADEFDLVKLKGAIGQLFDAQTNGNRIEKQWWPSETVSNVYLIG